MPHQPLDPVAASLPRCQSLTAQHRAATRAPHFPPVPGVARSPGRSDKRVWGAPSSCPSTLHHTPAPCQGGSADTAGHRASTHPPARPSLASRVQASWCSDARPRCKGLARSPAPSLLPSRQPQPPLAALGFSSSLKACSLQAERSPAPPPGACRPYFQGPGVQRDGFRVCAGLLCRTEMADDLGTFIALSMDIRHGIGGSRLGLWAAASGSSRTSSRPCGGRGLQRRADGGSSRGLVHSVS